MSDIPMSTSHNLESPSFLSGCENRPREEGWAIPGDGVFYHHHSSAATLALMRRRRGAGSIRRLKSGRYQARIVRPSGRRESLGSYRTRTEAERALVQAEASALKGEWTPTPADPGTVAEWAERWLASAHHLRPTTRAGYEQMLVKHVLPRWGNELVTNVKREHIEEWVRELVTAGARADVIRLSMVALRSTLKTALLAGILQTNPATGVSIPHRRNHEMHPLTIEQIEVLAEAISHPTLRPAGNGARVGRNKRPDLGLAVRLAAYTGLRSGELWGLRRKHFDLTRRTIRVVEAVSEVRGRVVVGTTKTGATRSVTWPEVLDSAIATHLANLSPDDYVFSNTAGNPIGHAAFMRTHFKPALQRAGLPPTIRFHDLRHSHASLLISMGVHPKVIQDRLGHSSIMVTMDTYGHLFPRVSDELAQGLDLMIRNSQGHDKGTGGRVRKRTKGENNYSPGKKLAGGVGLAGFEPATS